jgi:hypothetical protein
VTNYTVAIAQLIEAAKIAQAQQRQQAQAGN